MVLWQVLHKSGEQQQAATVGAALVTGGAVKNVSLGPSSALGAFAHGPNAQVPRVQGRNWGAWREVSYNMKARTSL